jgi:MHS family proline/betaine transporter-like MFS transporter
MTRKPPYPPRRLRLSYTIFGLGFAMRPLGGIFIGKIGDTYGRKRALEVSIWVSL